MVRFRGPTSIPWLQHPPIMEFMVSLHWNMDLDIQSIKLVNQASASLPPS
jgi:hypothetical protein